MTRKLHWAALNYVFGVRWCEIKRSRKTMNGVQTLFILCFPLLGGACSSIAVTYPSKPEGATVVCNGSLFGESL